jgi:hypothetical protein
VAIECGNFKEFSMIVDEFKNDNTLKDLPNILEQICTVETLKKKTLMITDERCL